MKRIAAVIVSLILMLSVSGCGMTDRIKDFFSFDENPQTVNEEGINKETENSITIGVTELDSYNPLICKSHTAKMMLDFIYEPLFGIDSQMHTVGVLASSYTTSPDGKSMRINLKQGVIWHDGTEFTSKDVVYTVKSIITNRCNYYFYLKDVSNITPEDNYTVDITFGRSVPNPATLFSFPIIKSGSFSDGFKPVGTGPFYLDYNKLSAFEAYHGNRANIDFINVKSIPDDGKFVTMFNASVIDVADSSVIDMKTYMPRSKQTVHNYVSNEIIIAGFNAKSAVFKFKEARKSVSMLIDRQGVASNIYFSQCEPVNYPVNPVSDYYPSSKGDLSSDSGGAENELKSNGWKTDSRGIYCYSDNISLTYFSVRILVNGDDPERCGVAEMISAKMNEIGMKNTVVQCPGDEFAKCIEAGNYDMFIGEIQIQPNNDLTDIVSSASNMFNYSDEETDILLAQLGTVTTESDKKDISSKLYERIKSECPFAPICFKKGSLITSAKIKSGAEPSVQSTVRQTESWSVK